MSTAGLRLVPSGSHFLVSEFLKSHTVWARLVCRTCMQGHTPANAHCTYLIIMFRVVMLGAMPLPESSIHRLSILPRSPHWAA